MNVRIEPSWKHQLSQEFAKPYFSQLTNFVRQEYQTTTIYPPASKIFHAFDFCPFNQAKVVIIGQDPYHGPNQANGLCFSVNPQVRVPPSLQNIFKEITADIGKLESASPDLSRWAKQGVFLLNATLTVRAGQPGSHQKKGWEEFTDAVIDLLNDQKDHLVFMLWGKYAQAKADRINTRKHLILTAAHPSPLSAYQGFFGCKHFSQANVYLALNGLEPIAW